MLQPYERSLQPGLVGAGRIVPVTGLARSEAREDKVDHLIDRWARLGGALRDHLRVEEGRLFLEERPPRRRNRIEPALRMCRERDRTE